MLEHLPYETTQSLPAKQGFIGAGIIRQRSVTPWRDQRSGRRIQECWDAGMLEYLPYETTQRVTAKQGFIGAGIGPWFSRGRLGVCTVSGVGHEPCI
jgi:hypothetical protein